MDNIEISVIEALSQITMQDANAIHMHMHLERDLGIDSLSIANLIGRFEELISLHPNVVQLVQSLGHAQTVEEFCALISTSC
jgi:acyl carrier protein